MSVTSVGLSRWYWAAVYYIGFYCRRSQLSFPALLSAKLAISQPFSSVGPFFIGQRVSHFRGEWDCRVHRSLKSDFLRGQHFLTAFFFFYEADTPETQKSSFLKASKKCFIFFYPLGPHLLVVCLIVLAIQWMATDKQSLSRYYNPSFGSDVVVKLGGEGCHSHYYSN